MTSKGSVSNEGEENLVSTLVIDWGVTTEDASEGETTISNFSEAEEFIAIGNW